MRTRVKVSDIASAGEVRAAVSAGADALGLVGEPAADGAPPVEREAAAACPPGVSPVLHTSREDPHAIADHAEAAGVHAVQLLRRLDPVVHTALRRIAPGLKLIQVLSLEDEHVFDLARGYGRLVDALLLESARAGQTVAELDGPLRPQDWRTPRRVVQDSAAPVWLAGGLTPGTVGEAIEQVNPFGVDVGSGVRTAGRMDARKLSTFFHAVRAAKGG